jgi:hypothetical protein
MTTTPEFLSTMAATAERVKQLTEENERLRVRVEILDQTARLGEIGMGEYKEIIERLRNALEVFASEKNWACRRGGYYEWEDSINPAEFARKALEGT